MHYAITFPPPYSAYDKYKAYTNYPSHHLKFADGKTSQSEKHLILDFQVGKDVGLGLFGKSGSSVLSAGVRIVQFGSNQNTDLRAEPDVQYPTAPITSKYENHAFLNDNKIRFHDYNGVLNAQRNFRGLGPSLAWSASVPFAGNTDAGEISIDWGANAAVLFGKQRVVEHHKTTTKTITSPSGLMNCSTRQELSVGIFEAGAEALYMRTTARRVPYKQTQSPMIARVPLPFQISADLRVFHTVMPTPK